MPALFVVFIPVVLFVTIAFVFAKKTTGFDCRVAKLKNGVTSVFKRSYYVG